MILRHNCKYIAFSSLPLHTGFSPTKSAVPFSPTMSRSFPKHKPTPQDKEYAKIAKTLYQEKRENSRCADYEVSENPIEQFQQKRTAVERQLHYARLVGRYRL